MSYQIGESSLFFIGIHDRVYEIVGFADKFDVIDADKVQSKIAREHEGQVLLISELDAEIRHQENIR